MAWRSILDGELKRRALEVAGEIVAAAVDGPPAPGGFDGAGGQACLMVYALQSGGDDSLATSGGERLDAMLAGLNAAQWTSGLWGGLAGVRFTVAHLAGGDEVGDALTSLDAGLLHQLDADPADANYDLISGLCGYGVAALEGGGAGEAIVQRVLDRLESLAQSEPGGLAWYTQPALLPAWQREECPDGYFNLGLAHGIPGVIGLLAKLIEAGVDVERSRRLLDGAVAWLLAIAPPRAGGRFPAWRGRGASDAPSRLAWCYGDPGVAAPLLAAARAAGNAAWEAEAIAIGHDMAARPMDQSGVFDMGLCHGAAGVAHIFNRMYQATGDEVLGDAARRWIERLLAMRRPGEPVAGFPALLREEGRERWTPDPGTLMGAVGVGLVLLAAATDVEPSWDRSLLCEIGPRAGDA